MSPRDLPIFELEDSIVKALREGSRLVLQAPTGSGKSTQVPQILLDHGLLGGGQVVVLQPRRLAARLLAARVASERAVHLGQEVGYQIRFENRTSKATRIRFVTEGILLRQLIDDPELRNISAILFDEFHERHLYGDITLARALQLQETARPGLKIVVMSATLEAANVEKYLAPCRVLRSSGARIRSPLSISKSRCGPKIIRSGIWPRMNSKESPVAPKAMFLCSCRASTRSAAPSPRSALRA